MSTIVTRAGKGSPLTNNEVDSNFTNLNTDKVQVTGAPTNGQAIVWNGTAWVPGDAGSNGSYTVSTATATAAQTSFTVSYTVGLLDVYQNGARLIPSTDYTATNGTSIVLTTGATLNDELMFVAFSGVPQSQTLTVTGAWTVKTANYTATGGDWLFCDTSAGAFTITLPVAPATNAFVRIGSGAFAQTNNVTVGRNGKTIMGLSENLVISDSNVSVDLVYDGTTWRIA